MDQEPREIVPKEQALAKREEQLEYVANILMERLNAIRVVASDLQDALYLIRDYQNVIARLFAPDPNIGSANKLLKKYQIEPGQRSEFFKVFLGALEITDPTELTNIESIFDHPIFDAESTATEDAGDLEDKGNEPPQLPSGNA